MLLPFLSLPKALICPATCAPTSTTSSGSTVPVAPIVATRSLRCTGAVRRVVSVLFFWPRRQAIVPPTTATTSTTTAMRTVRRLLPSTVWGLVFACMHCAFLSLLPHSARRTLFGPARSLPGYRFRGAYRAASVGVLQGRPELFHRDFSL